MSSPERNWLTTERKMSSTVVSEAGRPFWLQLPGDYSNDTLFLARRSAEISCGGKHFVMFLNVQIDALHAAGYHGAHQAVVDQETQGKGIDQELERASRRPAREFQAEIARDQGHLKQTQNAEWKHKALRAAIAGSPIQTGTADYLTCTLYRAQPTGCPETFRR